MPNFAGIHKLQFEKMESIKDNLDRKIERAILLKTPTKDKKDIQAAQKNGKSEIIALRKNFVNICFSFK